MMKVYITLFQLFVFRVLSIVYGTVIVSYAKFFVTIFQDQQ